MTSVSARHWNAGFTLIESAVVLCVVAILAGGIFFGVSRLIQSARTHDAITMASDLSGVAHEFRKKYHFLPGDFPVNATSPEIPGLPAQCVIGGAGAGNGDGLIQDGESGCLPEHLSKAGHIKGTVDPGTGLVRLSTTYGFVRVISNSGSGVAGGPNPIPATIRNVIEFASLPCEVALEIDARLDDGNLATGNIRASVALCVPSGLNDPVPFLATGL
jgi:prepilin-type N-terminal cleavage/methylation domain-containing protein